MDAWRWVTGEFATMKDLYLMLRMEEVVKQEVFYNAMTRCSHEGCTFYSEMGGVCVTRNNEETMLMKKGVPWVVSDPNTVY